MSRLTTSFLAATLSLALAGTASAQSPLTQNGYGRVDAPQVGSETYADYGTVVRVEQLAGAYGGGAPAGQRCYTQRGDYGDGAYAGTGGYRNDGYYDNGRYRNDGYYDNGRYRDGGYRTDGYADNGAYRNGGYNGGSQTGRTVATILGTVLGAAVGSNVGGGSGRYVTSALGSVVGGIAGQQVYESIQRQRRPQRVAGVTVCDPVATDSYGRPYPSAGPMLYEVTYDYAGRRYVTRTPNAYRVGDRIRVMVDVRAD